MKKILSLVLALVFFRCDDFVAVKVQKIDVDVYGTSRIAYIVVAHNDPHLITPYNNVLLPFDLEPFPLETGDTIIVGVLNLDTGGTITASIKADGHTLAEQTFFTETILKAIIP
jgi:hypothetical protein